MARSESALNNEISSNGTGRLKSFDGIVDYWDGTITLDKLSENKGKWKKRYLELQASQDYIYLLIYKPTHRKKKHTHVPIRKFSLIDESSPVYVGPNFKSKYTFDVGERVGKIFMRYRFGVDTEDSRNRWVYEIVTSFYINPNSQLCLKYLVTPMNTPVVTKLRMNEPSYLLLFKNNVELCRLSDLSRLGKWPVSSVHSYTTDKNIFTIKFKSSSMYGEIEILLYSDYTVEMFRILNSVITTGEFPLEKRPGVKRKFEVRKIPAIPPPPALPGMMGPINSTPNSPHMSPIFTKRNWVTKTISNPDQNRIFPLANYHPSSPQFNTTPYPHSPERMGALKNKKKKRRSIDPEEMTNDFDTYSKLSHFPNTSPVKKEKFHLNRTDDILTFSDLSQACHSTGNIPILCSTNNQSREGEYAVANFHRIPGLDRTKFKSGLFIRSNSDQDISDKPPLPLKKTYSNFDLLSDDENPYDVIPDVNTKPQKLESQVFVLKKLPPPPPQPSDYISVTLPERGRGMRKSPSTDSHIGFGSFPLEENRQWGRDMHPNFTSPQHNLLEDIKEL